MIYKTVMLESDESKWVERYLGHPNHLPPGFKKAAIEDLMSYLCDVPKHIYYKQVYEDGLIKFGLNNYDTMVLYHFGWGAGYAVVNSWRDKAVLFFTFDCIDLIKEDFNNLPIVGDTGWSQDNVTSRPSRGICDFNRIIKVERELTNDELKTLSIYFGRTGCPGTGVGIGKNGLEYHCRTTLDCSD